MKRGNGDLGCSKARSNPILKILRKPVLGSYNFDKKSMITSKRMMITSRRMIIMSKEC